MSSTPGDRAKRQLAAPHGRGGNKHKRVGPDAPSRNSKRGRAATSNGGRKTGAARSKPAAEPPQEAPPPRAAHAAPGIPPQELAVGEKVQPNDPRVGRPQ